MTPAEFAASGLWASNHLNISTYITLASVPSEIANPASPSHAPTIFNPTNLDFDEYLDWAERLGCAGALITTKHHDGFCLWPSDVAWGGNQRTIKQSTWYQKNGQRNVLLEWVTKTRARGLRVGYYFSPWDEFRESLVGGTPAAVGAGNYTNWTTAQLAEILDANVYGSIDFILLDGWGNTWSPGSGVSYTDVVYLTVYNAIKAAQPGCVVCVNDHEDGSEGTLHGEVSLWERPADGEPTQGAITNFQAGALWNTTQKKISDANAVAWFDHTDGDTLTASDANQAIGRRYRMDRLTSPKVATLLNFSSYPDGRLAADTRLMLAEIARPVGTLIARDNFSLRVTESTGVTLQAHTSIEGSTWTKDFGNDAVLDPYGILRINDNVNGGSYVYNTSPANANYRAEADFKFLSVPSAFTISVRMRATDSTHDNRLKADWNGTTFTIALQRHNAGLVTLQQFTTNSADHPATGKLYRIAVEKSADELRGELWIDHSGTGNEYLLWGKLFNTETVITSTGKPGIYIFGLGSATTGMQVTDFRVIAKDTTAPSAPTMLAPEARVDGILLRWTGAPADLWKYKIYRSTDGISFQHLGNSSNSEYFDSTVTSGVTYYYQVRALDLSFNASAASNTVGGATAESITTVDFTEQDRARLKALVPVLLTSSPGGILVESTTVYTIAYSWVGFAPATGPFIGDDVIFYDESAGRQQSRRRIVTTELLSGFALRITVNAAPDFVVAADDSLAIVRSDATLTSDPQLIDDLSQALISGGVGGAPISAGRWNDANRWRFDSPLRLFANNTVVQNQEFDGLLVMDFTNVLPRGTRIYSIGTPSITPASGVAPQLGAPAADPSGALVLLPVNVKTAGGAGVPADARTYTITVPVATTDADNPALAKGGYLEVR